jgi:hypothetical protein
MPRTRNADTGARVGPRLVAKPVRAKSARAREVSHEQIAVRAYELFLQEGGGSEVHHWLRAEQELLEAPPAVRPARKVAGARMRG